ncbi:hypothetical protein GCM10022204_26440 [Microlunatus aurantiacus]|uniref:M23ase beta-sheet core domain-containing protein n=1 Tax=Microlunatus aurantiacus TaxID=446786 RepID=A0ABP7DPF3_9ACTN
MTSALVDPSTDKPATRRPVWLIPLVGLLSTVVVLGGVGLAIWNHQLTTWSPPIADTYPPGCGFNGVGCPTRSLVPRQHQGLDYPAPAGTPVTAVHAGTVTRSESITGASSCEALPSCGGPELTGYGNLVVIDLAGGDRIQALYAHLTERHVAVGDTVHAGEVIGTVGYQGNVAPLGPDGAHLHFAITQDGRSVDPAAFLRSKAIRA